jgi:mono/diheme cytochrome c family protein
MRFKLAVLGSVLVMTAAAAPAAPPMRIYHPPAGFPSLGPIGDGRRAWLEYNCYGCHGDNASGGMGPNIQGAEAGDVTEAVLHGDAKEGGMRSFKGIVTAKQVKTIVAYLKSIGTPKEPTWLDWWNDYP